MRGLMAQILYSGRPELAHPSRFLRTAVRDLSSSPAIAMRLFGATLLGRRRRSILGHAWILIPAAATALVCVYLKSSGIVTMPQTPLPYPVHVLTGMILWQTFLDALNAPLQQLSASRHLITRSRIPHEAIILTGGLEVGLNALVRLAALALVLAAFGIAPAPGGALLLPLGMAGLACLGGSLGLLAAPWGLLFDDVKQGLVLIATFLFFLTPVVYPEMPGSLLTMNPVALLLSGARSSLLTSRMDGSALVVLAISVVLLLSGWLLYRLARPHVVERLA